jgi:methyltransferase (TIGR00027 family)
MRERLPSQTAAQVAVLRALADRGYTHVEGFADPVARHLLSGFWSGLLRVAERGFERLQPEMRDRIIDELDVVARRVRVIDDELERRVAEGVRQVVILGAGLDTRALRMTALAQADVFEVDHPASQEFKKRKASTLPVAAKSLRFVRNNFERDELAPALSAAGFEPAQQSVWVCEGVVMYLTDAALAETLRAVAALSARGSTLLLQYHLPRGARRLMAWNRLITRGVGEPQIGLRTREQMSDAVERAGFGVLRDLQVDERHPNCRLLIATR